jgi:aminoglycoside phosphotransferase (APT) family kinase protein/putative sterol carrier protein
MPQASNLSISDLQRSKAGISNETFLFDLTWEEAGHTKSEEMVLRLAPQAYPVYPQYDLSRQFHIMEILQSTKVPVPKTYWLEQDDTLLGAPFYLMGRVEGFVLPEYPPYHSFGPLFEATPQHRASMWWQAIEIMAELHKLQGAEIDLSFLNDNQVEAAPLDRELTYFERYLSWVDEDHRQTQPILSAALDWLRENLYTPEVIGLCWGDCRLPNMMYSQEGRVVAVLDWEMAYIGDPEADLAFFLYGDWQHSEGYGMPRLEGCPSEEETLRRYETLTGRGVTHLHFNEVWAALRAGIVQLKVFKNFREMGIALPSQDIEQNNTCTQRLASLLDLPSPGGALRETTSVDTIKATVQFRLTGPGGSDWYVIADKGVGTRHEGVAEKPDVTLIAAAADWAAIQRGETDRTQAWLEGKIKIEGDMPLMLQLEDMISKLST